jgi:hypothetical protein
MESKPPDEAKAAAESKDDKIIRVTAFHRLDGVMQVWGHDLDPLVWANHGWPYGDDGWRKELPHLPPKGPPTTGLGALDRFPVEIVHGILAQLTVRGTMRFRNVNRRGREIVNNMVEYKAVTTHAFSCFHAVFRTHISETLRFADIFRAMCMQHCEQCKRVGDYIHLPSLTRCCLRCLHLDPGLRTVRLNHFDKIDYRTLRKLVRVVLGIPRGNWYVEEGDARLRRRTNLIDYTTALQVLRSTLARPSSRTHPSPCSLSPSPALYRSSTSGPRPPTTR